MASLIEKYNEIYQKIYSLNAEIEKSKNEINLIEEKRDEEIPARIENLKKTLEKIDEYQLAIEAYIQIAEKHMTSRNLPTIEAPEGYRVNLERLRQWSMLINPLSGDTEDDPYAKRVYLVSKCDQKFLEQKKEEFTDKLTVLETDYSVGAPEEIRILEEGIQRNRQAIKEFLGSPEMISFAETVREENTSRMNNKGFEEYVPSQEEPKYWVPGAIGTAIDLEEDDRKQLKGLLDVFYDEVSSKVYLPLERITSKDEFTISVNCVPARKRTIEMDAGIRNLLFQIIDKSPVGSRKVYVIDAIRQNSTLIGGLKDLEGSFALEKVPRNTDQIQDTLEEIVSSFIDIDEVIENFDSVAEYNATVPEEKKIRRTVVVIVGWPKSFEGRSRELINKIIANYERYGLSFIAVNITSMKKERDYEEDNEIGISEYAGESLIQIKMTTSDTTISFGQGEEHSFAWYTFKKSLSADYCNTLKSYSVEKGGPVTEYVKHFDLDAPVTYTRGKKNLSLPYGVDSRNKVYELAFDNECFASYLMGASGSGKSTLIHTLITGIIRNYHPDDVELWLADFKMSEFSQYIDPMPPHVKYILLDESQELVYDLIDKLTEKMMERQKYFMRNRQLKKVESVPVETHMPIIFVLLDEFSIMSQSVAESEEYKLKLQNLLAKGRALGIKFLFSSQTYTTGISGLTTTAKAQIQLRIAMKGEREEISQTLDLAASQKTEQVTAWLDALPPHYALVKYRVEDQMFVQRVQVMYFKGTPEKPYIQQENLIRKVKGDMRSSETYDISDPTLYMDKNPVVVDGNSYHAYDPVSFRAFVEDSKNSGLTDKDAFGMSFGVPRLMTNIKIVSLTPESRENVILFAPLNEQECAVSIMLSVCKEMVSQQCEADLWAYERNKMYQKYGKLFKDYASVEDTTQEIYKEIRELKNNIEKGITGNKTIFIMGLERICGEFDFTQIISGDSSLENRVKEKERELIASGAVITDPIELRKLELNKEIKKKKELVEKKELSKKDYLLAVQKAREEIEQMIANGGVKKTEEKAPAETEKQSEAEEKVTLEDLLYIIKQGSRLGYHFFVTFQNLSDMKESGLKINWFRHRLSFVLSADDSTEVFNKRIASKLSQHVCQYSDLLNRFSFRPYLHKDIEWDGWTLDTDGKVVSPFDVEEL